MKNQVIKLNSNKYRKAVAQVKPGEDITAVAQRLGTTTQQLLAANPELSKISTGQYLNAPGISARLDQGARAGSYGGVGNQILNAAKVTAPYIQNLAAKALLEVVSVPTENPMAYTYPNQPGKGLNPALNPDQPGKGSNPTPTTYPSNMPRAEQLRQETGVSFSSYSSGPAGKTQKTGVSFSSYSSGPGGRTQEAATQAALAISKGQTPSHISQQALLTLKNNGMDLSNYYDANGNLIGGVGGGESPNGPASDLGGGYMTYVNKKTGENMGYASQALAGGPVTEGAVEVAYYGANGQHWTFDPATGLTKSAVKGKARYGGPGKSSSGGGDSTAASPVFQYGFGLVSWNVGTG